MSVQEPFNLQILQRKKYDDCLWEGFLVMMATSPGGTHASAEKRGGLC